MEQNVKAFAVFFIRRQFLVIVDLHGSGPKQAFYKSKM
jgi:hypothetical protein